MGSGGRKGRGYSRMWLNGRRMVSVAADGGTTFDVAVICRRVNAVVRYDVR